MVAEGYAIDQSRPALRLIALACGFALIAALPLAGESVVSGEIKAGSTATVNADGLAGSASAAYGIAKFGVDTTGSGAIKASAKASIDKDGTVTLERAYFKTRFPGFIADTSIRFSAGKSPLAWGRGFVFNAGDPVFGSIPTSITIGDSEYRTDTDWMGTVYIPVGDFSFVEAAEFPPVARTTNRTGGRLCLTPAWDALHSIEAGYLYEERDTHRAYLAFDGTYYFDYYGAVSVTKKGERSPHIAASAGLLRIFSVNRDVNVTVRAEGLIYPEYDRELWYGLVQAGFNDEVIVGFQGLFATGTEQTGDLAAIAEFAGASALSYFPSYTGFAGFVASWVPIKGITLTASVLKRFDKGDPWKPEAFITAGVSCLF